MVPAGCESCPQDTAHPVVPLDRSVCSQTSHLPDLPPPWPCHLPGLATSLTCHLPGPATSLAPILPSLWPPLAVGVNIRLILSLPAKLPKPCRFYSVISVLGPGDLLLVVKRTESETGRCPGPRAALDRGSGLEPTGDALPAGAGGTPLGPRAAQVSTVTQALPPDP